MAELSIPQGGTKMLRDFALRECLLVHFWPGLKSLIILPPMDNSNKPTYKLIKL